MDIVNKKLIDSYLKGDISGEDAKLVLEWFGTEEGGLWLAARFDEDAAAVIKKLNPVSEVNPIPASLNNPGEESHSELVRKAPLKRSGVHRNSTSRWIVAAAVLLMATLISLFQFYYQDRKPPTSEVYTEYATSAEEHRIITMNDGTRVRLNELSSIRIPDIWESELRRVELQGEAFFEVASDSLRPFVVKAGSAEIRVLGTAFNVKTMTPAGEMVVAVSEGRVSLGDSGSPSDRHPVLEKNMLGLYNPDTNEITATKTDISNYVSWMHGRVIYHATPFGEVVKQLNHIYDLRNEIQDEELYSLKLTADFSERSVDNVLETIARSLGIDMKREGQKVVWQSRNNSQALPEKPGP